MIFARYIGEDGPAEPCLTPGKIYLADNGGGTTDVLDDSTVALTDDCGNRVKVDTSAGQFEFLAEVYAVVVRMVGNYDKGQAVVVTDADDAGEYFQVDGRYYKATNFELLDRTNLRPGIMVQMPGSGKWVKVMSVTEKMELRVGERDLLPTDFRFAVGNGGVLAEPMVKCVSDEGTNGELTVDCLYRVVGTEETTLQLVNNHGKTESYLLSRFTWDY